METFYKIFNDDNYQKVESIEKCNKTEMKSNKS